MMTCDFLITKAEESSGVVVKDVPLLRSREEIRRFDRVDGDGNRVGPYHVVGAEHDPLPEPSLHKTPQVVMELLARQNPVDHAHVHVDLRVRLQEGDHLIEQRPTGMHDVQAHLRMTEQRLLQ